MEDDKVVKLKKNVKTETSKKKTNKDNREGQRERKKHAKAVYGKHVEGELERPEIYVPEPQCEPNCPLTKEWSGSGIPDPIEIIIVLSRGKARKEIS